jgi:hypothetical protein
MKRDKIAQINYDFFCSDVVLGLLNFNFTMAVMTSFDKPIKFDTYGKNKGFIIISNQITGELEKKLFMEQITLGLIESLSEKIKHHIRGTLSNQVNIELESFIFEFKIMKYAISSRPNLSWVTVNDLNKIYGNEDIHPIVDLKINSVFDD